MESKRRNVWITSSNYVSSVCDKLPSNEGRQSLVSSLIQAYGLDTKCSGIIPIPEASVRDLQLFHGREYVQEIVRNRSRKVVMENKFRDDQTSSTCVNNSDQEIDPEIEIETEQHDNDEKAEDFGYNDLDKLSKFGLAYDCYLFEGLDEYVKLVAGSSIASAKKLIAEFTKEPETQTVCINWYGGRHHCHKNYASGFCYVNDIVLAINTLRTRFKNIFYLDLDLHHGDGVENAFRTSKSVTTCSIHRYDVGFFPGTGLLESSTSHIFNLPTRKGSCDETLMNVIEQIILPIIDRINPDVLVIQCGCDGLVTDKYKEWNLTINGFGSALRRLLNANNRPVLLLGGGGYNNEEVAKCWTYLTRVALHCEKEDEQKEKQEEDHLIPDHKFLDFYHKSGYSFWTPQNMAKSKMKDHNNEDYIEGIKEYFINCSI